jgi:hypothetical protein
LYILSYIFRKHPFEIRVFSKCFLDAVDGALYIAFDHTIDLDRHLESEQVAKCREGCLTDCTKYTRIDRQKES